MQLFAWCEERGVVARRSMWMWGAGAVALLWVARGALAGDAGEPRRTHAGYAAESAKTATRLPGDERLARSFLRTASASARFEFEAGRLAAVRADTSSVRAHALDLLESQEPVHVELLRLLHARGMAAPMMDNAQRRALQRLSRASGPKFDREYMELMGSRRQREDVRHYERAMLGITDPSLREFIDRQLPTLREQQSAAARLAAPARRAETMRPTPVASRPGRQRTE